MAVAGSVIVRAKNRAGTIERTLAAIRNQTVDVELIVVDSGSTDGTLDIAHRLSDRVIEIPSERFTYGRALNIGADAASAPIHFALSAHCVPESRDWIERSLSHYERPEVAATNGGACDPEGGRLLNVFYQDAATLRAHPLWGFSNHAASWRAAVWAEHPFNEDMEACEDKEWSWRVIGAGWLVAYDPHLYVGTTHRKGNGLTAYFNRVEREWRELARYADLPPFGVRDAVAQWWHGDPPSTPPLFHRLNYYRIAETAAKYIGSRRGRRSKASPVAGRHDPGSVSVSGR